MKIAVILGLDSSIYLSIKSHSLSQRYKFTKDASSSSIWSQYDFGVTYPRGGFIVDLPDNATMANSVIQQLKVVSRKLL